MAQPGGGSRSLFQGLVVDAGRVRDQAGCGRGGDRCREAEVQGKAFDEKNLFSTLFTALGIDPYAQYDIGDLPSFHRVEDRAEPIREVLA